MTANQFVARLQRINSRFRFVLGPSFVSGLYLNEPQHPEAKENGLRWVGAIPSPRFFRQLPEKDLFDENKQYHRGWKTIVSRLVTEGVIKKSSAINVFGRSWQIPGKAGKLSAIPGWNDKTRLEKAEEHFGKMAGVL